MAPRRSISLGIGNKPTEQVFLSVDQFFFFFSPIGCPAVGSLPFQNRFHEQASPQRSGNSVHRSPALTPCQAPCGTTNAPTATRNERIHTKQKKKRSGASSWEFETKRRDVQLQPTPLIINRDDPTVRLRLAIAGGRRNKVDQTEDVVAVGTRPTLVDNHPVAYHVQPLRQRPVHNG